MYTSNLTPVCPASDVASRSSKDSVFLPPSSTLPPLSKLSTFTSYHISRVLGDLKALYWPPKTHFSSTSSSVVPSNLVLPTRKLKHLQLIHDHSVPDSGYASAEEDEEDDEDEEEVLVEGAYLDEELNERAEVLRADPFERAFAIKWVTGFIARADIWVEEACVDEEDEGLDESEGDSTREWKSRQEVVDKATAILGLFIGDEGSGEDDAAVTRTFSFPFGSAVDDLGGEGAGQQVVKAELNDDPLDNTDHTSVGLQSWASAIVMSEKMCADPVAFSLGSTDVAGNRRILELGAGTGLLSIVAARILELQSQSQSHSTKHTTNTIIATDFHPDVLANCTRNVETNFPFSSSASASAPTSASHSPILVQKLDWEYPDYTHPVDDPFDIILAADVIYHPEHAKWIRGVVERLLRKPTTKRSTTASQTSSLTTDDTDTDTHPPPRTGGIFWMMMAVRSTGRHEGLDKTVDEVFADSADDEDSQCQWKLTITHRAEFAKQGGLGRADEGGYKLFGIEWV
ncbi:hypothetical protein D9758_009931 [Tetrapyrgos nigripes]|uniref:S-adenosylmethionine-dependent methyltransferase n=1 Tax=Tetrapyrgos nigripes TaxID=182062 RepID=A0A8H5CQP6_9AGAR|nr:hypothetical protein D9758_009931 [Tetrapyrgos nigripes]